MVDTLYRRTLPEHAIPFSSPDGRRLFSEALAAGGLDGYFPLAEQFHTQAEPTFCGLGSLVVALNALAIDPGRTWRGPWRWFSEELLDCCVSLDEIRRRGLDLDELACLARCNGAEVELQRANPDNLGAWRAALAIAASGAAVVVASYDRAALDQTGSGHFSPIGGYHTARDLALVLDVARFKYPAHWLSAERLWRAMHSIDPDTGKARGWMVLRRRARELIVGFSLSCEGHDLQGFARHLAGVLAEIAPTARIEALAHTVAPLVAHVITRAPSSELHQQVVASTREALRSLPVFPQIAAAVGAERAEAVLLLLLALSDRLPAALRDELARGVAEHETLAADVAHLQAQLAALWTIMAAREGSESRDDGPSCRKVQH